MSSTVTTEKEPQIASDKSDTVPPENPRKRGLGWARGRGGKKARGGFSRPPKHRLPREETETLRWTENDFGITEYISTYPGFSGVIKQRFSDFLVNELKPDGTEVHLSNLEPPSLEDEQSPVDAKSLSTVLPQDICDKIDGLFNNTTTAVEIVVTDKDKDERRNIHDTIKKVYGRKVTSTTLSKGTEKVIMVTLQNNDTPQRREAWPVKKGEFVHFSIYKENMDTQEAVNLLSAKLYLKANLMTYAGTKDRRAKTCQRACVKRIDPKKLASAARTLRNLSIGDFEFCNAPLQLGQLSGNRFQIVLRNVTGTDEQIKCAMESLSKEGFLNYYGLQRFGTQSVPTHHIGRALLQGNWQEAVELILKPRGPGESPNLQEMRKLWWKTRDAGQAFKLLHGRDKCIEGQLLLGLIKNNKNDLVNALESIPRNARLMYLHSYQSYIWNQVMSRRVKEFGLHPIEGDLVLVEDSPVPDSAIAVEENGSTETENADSEPVNTFQLPAVRMLSASEVATHSLHDVVLPLPGYSVTYPGHAAAQWFEELMAKDGLSTAALKQNIRKYTLGGTYRKMAVVPSKVSWQLVSYSDATKPLIHSDMDIIQKKAAFKEEPEGAYKALVLDFCLPSSVYATMALRELLKCDTSARHQTTLNSYSVLSEVKSEEAKPPTQPPSVQQEATEAAPALSSVDITEKPMEAEVTPAS